MTIGELIAILGVDTSDLDVAEGRLRDFLETAERKTEDAGDVASGALEKIAKFAGVTTGQLTAILAVVTAVGLSMLKWWKGTVGYAEKANIVTRAYHQVLTDMLTTQRSHLWEAIALAKEENKLREQNLLDAVKQAKLAKEIRGYRLEVYDVEASLEDRIKSITSAISAQEELTKSLVDSNVQELAIAGALWAMDKNHLVGRKKISELSAQYWNLQDQGVLILQRQLTMLEKQAEAQAKARKEYYESISIGSRMEEVGKSIAKVNTLEKLLGENFDDVSAKIEVYTGTLQEMIEDGVDPASKEIQQLVRQINDLTKLQGFEKLKEDTIEWAREIQILNTKMPTKFYEDKGPAYMQLRGAPKYHPDKGEGIGGDIDLELLNEGMQDAMRLGNMMSRTFEGIFSSIGEGSQRMAEMFIDSIRRMVAEIAAKAIAFLFLQIISGGAGTLATGAKELIGGGFGKFLLSGFRHAEGMFTVPSGYPNDSYPAALSSGETILTPAQLRNLAGANAWEGKVEFEIKDDRLYGILKKYQTKNSLY